MAEVNQGIESNPAAPFGGGKQSRTRPERRPGVIKEFLETEYLAIPVD